MKNLTWQNPEQLFVAQELINKVKSKCCGIKDKYKDVSDYTGKLLPVLCNQRMNSYLKEIADVCGIHKNLSTHTARHSYATSICLANGVSMENVAKMLGHADTSVTKHYARVLDQNIFKDMQKVNSCLSELAI